MKYCFHCKNRLEIGERPSRGESCPHCGHDLKACVNCRFYDEYADNQCTEPMAERVADKERANFCEYFVFREREPRAEPPVEDRLRDLKRLFTDAS